MAHSISMAIAAVLTVPALAWGQAALDDIRRDVRETEPPRSQPAHAATSGDASDSDGDSDNLLGDVIGALLGSFFFSAHEGVDYEPAPPMYFLDYPYQGLFPGYLSNDLLGSKTYAAVWKDRIRQHPWFGRVSFDEGFDFGNDLNRLNGNLLLDSSVGWGVQTDWNVLTQRHSGDTLAVGNTHLTYRFLESRRLMMRGGVGVNTLVDRSGTDWGFNFHFDADWFPHRPFVASTVFDAGTLGSSTLLHTRGTLGILYRRAEFFGGYDWLQIGSTDVHGPLVGVRFWF